MTVMMAECKSVYVRYREVLATLRCIVELRNGKKVKQAATVVKLRESFVEDRKVTVPNHPAELARLKAKVMDLKNLFEAKKLELCTSSGLVNDAARLCEKIKTKVRFKALDSDVPFEGLEVVKMEDVAIQCQVASFSSADTSAAEREKSDRATLRQKHRTGTFNEQEIILNRHLDTLKEICWN